MPTIQVKTDDRTKTASTALFQQVGITMSDAVNLFLRQSIMRGGIPFQLTVTGIPETGAEIFENEALIDALKRYKSVSGKDDFDIAKTEPFFRAVKTLDSDKSMRITLTRKRGKDSSQFQR